MAFEQTNANDAEKVDSEVYIGPSHSFSFLKETPVGIRRLAQPGDDSFVQGAISEIDKMSSRLRSSEVRTPIESSSRFHIPSKSAGYSLLGKFLEYAELGKPFFSFPSEDILRQVVFEPENVRERAWVVSFNYILLAAISTHDDEHEEKLRQNSQLALNDSRIFLEPSLANIQALALLAVHGEDYAAPNTSWMLLGHACRQAEALGLHIRSGKDTLNEWQHKLCLFWLLFTLDKSCALAFGRPAFLPLSVYQHVPLPDEQFMCKFSPHEKTQNSSFGSVVLKSTITLAKLMSDVLVVLSVGESGKSKEDIWSNLEGWFAATRVALTQAMEDEQASADAHQIREMKLGINSVNFQYLHILTLLLKGDRSSALRLSCAREAISILPSLVSNWGSVYNGVVWQLLYYPFTPFFVIFENIVQQPSQYTGYEDDLRLLATAVNYYAEMRSQMRLLSSLCSKLEHTTSVFFQLAQSHAGNLDREKAPKDKAPISQEEESVRPWDDLINMDLSDLNITPYLNWLPIDMSHTSQILETELQGPNPQPSHNSEECGPAHSEKPISGSTFDWFLWDDYYGSSNVGL
ncbi:hypothetical protein N7456_001622 [Penicillium angulare]|uniref:Xylanolytic transcriptional activator regulatory domain-containing protein n=1 Tax=Penicillium angulare TaxID=116970 RepID=A0A9W9G709_9EURO|nr:hypothetical protein N7456_001622 [Penicillium angulare]